MIIRVSPDFRIVTDSVLWYLQQGEVTNGQEVWETLGEYADLESAAMDVAMRRIATIPDEFGLKELLTLRLELQVIRNDLRNALKDLEKQPSHNMGLSWYADYLLDLRCKREELRGQLASMANDDPAKARLAEDLAEAERRIAESSPNSLLGALIQMEQLVQWARNGIPAYAEGSIDVALKTLPKNIERLRRQREVNAAQQVP